MSVTGIFTPKAQKKLTHGIAVSLVFQDYVEPILLDWIKMDPRPSYRNLNKNLRFPWTIWNAVVLSDFYPKADDKNMIDWMRKLMCKRPEEKALAEWWIDRKRTEFRKYRYPFW